MRPASSTQAVSPTAASSSPQVSRSSAPALALAQSTVMPRPTAAGVFGMARTTGVSAPNTCAKPARRQPRSEEHTSELQSLMRSSYAVFCLKKKPEYDKHSTTKQHEQVKVR